MSKVTTRSRAQRRRKRPSPTKRESKNATRVSALVGDLGAAGLAKLMQVSARSVQRWKAGQEPAGAAAAPLGVLDALDRAHLKIQALPGQLHLLVEDAYEKTHSVPFAAFWRAWWEKHPEGEP